MELSGVHIGRKVEITWVGPRANPPRTYKKSGTLRQIEHLAPKGKSLGLLFEEKFQTYNWSKGSKYYTYNTVPFYADVKIIEDKP